MKSARLVGVACILLGALMAVVALLGPLVGGIIVYRVSPAMVTQLLGGEIASLVVAGPMAVVAGVLWLRGHRLAPTLSIAPALYAVYTYVQFVAGPEYARYPGNNERFFPLFLALVILGWTIAARSWAELRSQTLPVIARRWGTLVGVVLLALNVLFAAAWVASIRAALSPPGLAEYAQDQTLFWLVRLMDLGFVIPAFTIAGVALVRHTSGSARLAYALTGFQTLMVAAVGAMATAMYLRDDPESNTVLLVATVASTLMLGALYVKLLIGANVSLRIEAVATFMDDSPPSTRGSLRVPERADRRAVAGQSAVRD